MAQKYYNVKEAAGVLGLSEAEVKQMQERRELHGYRDGMDWKFKVEDIERVAKDRANQVPAPAEDEGGDVLLSEVELGQSDPGLSGTVIGVKGGKAAAAESDIQIGASDIKIAESDIKLAESDIKIAGEKDSIDSKVSQFEELDMTLDGDLTLEDSTPAARAKKAAAGDSAVDLSGQSLDDDDLVLGGSGTGSDITIGGDSGISLVDPADSGLSLEEPLNLNPSTDESLELGEDDLLSFSTDTGSAAGMKSEDDFQLTPLDEAGDGEDSESGSQVIALDTEEGDEAATMIAGGGGVAAMLDEDLSEPALGLAPSPLAPAGSSGIGLEAQPDAMALASPMLQPAALLPEAPYSIWNVLSLVICSLFLILVGMMMYDLLRNMWSWDTSAHVQPLNSSLIDWLLSLFEK